MQDVNQMIENLKDGNYNNYVGDSGRNSPANESSKQMAAGVSPDEN